MNKTIRILLMCYSAVSCSMSVFGMRGESPELECSHERLLNMEKRIGELNEKVSEIYNTVQTGMGLFNQLNTRVDQGEAAVLELGVGIQMQDEFSNNLCKRQKKISYKLNDLTTKIDEIYGELDDLSRGQHKISKVKEPANYDHSGNTEKFKCDENTQPAEEKEEKELYSDDTNKQRVKPIKPGKKDERKFKNNKSEESSKVDDAECHLGDTEEVTYSSESEEEDLFSDRSNKDIKPVKLDKKSERKEKH